MKRKRRELHLWPHWKDGAFQTVHVPEGVIADYRVLEVHEPFHSTLRGFQRKIFDVGYRWVYFTPLLEKHSVILALDETNRPLQVYVDITQGNSLNTDGFPVIDDVYLDVLAWIEVEPDGDWHIAEPEIIDADELDDALLGGAVSQDQYAAAWAEAQQVKTQLREQNFAALQVVQQYMLSTNEPSVHNN